MPRYELELNMEILAESPEEAQRKALAMMNPDALGPCVIYLDLVQPTKDGAEEESNG